MTSLTETADLPEVGCSIPLVTLKFLTSFVKKSFTYLDEASSYMETLIIIVSLITS